MSEKSRMLAGRLYHADDAELSAMRKRAKTLVYRYNQTAPDEEATRADILAQLVDDPSHSAHLELPTRLDYGGNLHLGRNFFANYDSIFLDVAPITIGDNVLFGPRVAVLTAGHPLDAQVRGAGLEFGRPIAIGDNVWLGGSVTICPGVTIGANAIVGAGAVVTKDVPPDTVVAGIPARPLRRLTDDDRRQWQQAQAAYRREADAE